MNPHFSYSKLIVEEIQRDPRYPSFGAHIAELAEPSIRRGEKNLPVAATKLIDELIHAVRNLTVSDNLTDKDVFGYAIQKFKQDDMHEFVSDMGDELSDPPFLHIYNWIKRPRPDQHRDIALLAIWNRSRRQDFQKRLDNDTPQLIENTIARVEYLVKEGIYPKETPQLYSDTIRRHGPYRAMDSFESGLAGADGWCDKLGKVSLANLYTDRRHLAGLNTQFHGVAYHEDTHSMGAWGRGFFYGIVTPHHPLRVWEEFWASHSQASTDLVDTPHRSGRPYHLNPDARLDKIRYYFDEGRYVWNIHKLTNQGIPADMIGHAYVSMFDPENPSTERRELEHNILKVFGTQEQWFAVEDEYEAHETQADRQQHIVKAIRHMNGHLETPSAQK